MKRKYESPDIEIVKLSLSADVLTVSEGEITTSSGVIHDPDEDMEEGLEP